MHETELREINDCPWFWDDELCNETGHRSGVAFLVRTIGYTEPFGVIIARDRDELFWLIDELTDPYRCEVSVMVGGEAYFSGINNQPTLSEELEYRTQSTLAWRPVDDGTLFPEERAKKLSKRKKEVASLGRLFTDLRRKVNARTDRHG